MYEYCKRYHPPALPVEILCCCRRQRTALLSRGASVSVWRSQRVLAQCVKSMSPLTKWGCTRPRCRRCPPWAQPNKTFCSRFICEVLQAGGVEAFQVQPLLSSCWPSGPRHEYLPLLLESGVVRWIWEGIHGGMTECRCQGEDPCGMSPAKLFHLVYTKCNPCMDVIHSRGI